MGNLGMRCMFATTAFYSEILGNIWISCWDLSPKAWKRHRPEKVQVNFVRIFLAPQITKERPNVID